MLFYYFWDRFFGLWFSLLTIMDSNRKTREKREWSKFFFIHKLINDLEIYGSCCCCCWWWLWILSIIFSLFSLIIFMYTKAMPQHFSPFFLLHHHVGYFFKNFHHIQHLQTNKKHKHWRAHSSPWKNFHTNHKFNSLFYWPDICVAIILKKSHH